MTIGDRVRRVTTADVAIWLPSGVRERYKQERVSGVSQEGGGFRKYSGGHENIKAARPHVKRARRTTSELIFSRMPIVPCFPLPAVVEAGLGDAPYEFTVLDGQVDHIESLVLGAIACLLAVYSVAGVRLANKI